MSSLTKNELVLFQSLGGLTFPFLLLSSLPSILLLYLIFPSFFLTFIWPRHVIFLLLLVYFSLLFLVYRMSRDSIRVRTNLGRSDACSGTGMFWGTDWNLYLRLPKQSPTEWHWLGMGWMFGQHWLWCQICSPVHRFRWEGKRSSLHHELAQQRSWKIGKSISSISSPSLFFFHISNFHPTSRHVTFSPSFNLTYQVDQHQVASLQEYE